MMRIMWLLFITLVLYSSGSLFSADSANSASSTISCEMRMSFRSEERVAYQSIKSHSAVMPTDHTSLMRSHEAYRSSLSARGYSKASSSDSSHIAFEPSPLLPQNFRDDFSTPWFWWDRSVEYFKNQFNEKLKRLGIGDQPNKVLQYERAEMRRWAMYESCEFRDFLKELSIYSDYILEISAELVRDAKFAEAVACACSEDSLQWIRDEASRVQGNRRQQAIIQQFRQDAHSNFVLQRERCDNDTRLLYDDYALSDGMRFVKRSQAAAEIQQSGVHYKQQSYTVSKEAVSLLRKLGIHGGPYTVCYGNQLQQAIHQECVDLIERTAQLKSGSPIFEYQSALVYYIESAHIYNKVGLTHNASLIADFCYTLLDYGKAVLEGTRDGLLGVAQQALNDPLQTVASATLSVAAGEYMLAYQLGKITYGILKLTVNAVINPEQAKETWDGYIAPISGLIDALKNKQLSLREGIRAGTALAVSMKAQSMLANGCEKMCSIAKTRALKYAAKNPLAHPEKCMEGRDNFAFKAARDKEWTSHDNKHKPPKGFSWKEIIKQTKHGDAKYKPEINREQFERMAWEKGTPVTNGKTWKVMKADYTIGAISGVETPYVRIEMSANTLHGHPITLAEYRKLLK